MTYTGGPRPIVRTNVGPAGVSMIEPSPHEKVLTAPSTRIYREVSTAKVETGLCRYFRNKFARVNELIAKPRMNFRIEYLLEPVEGQGAARRLARIRVIGEPYVQ